MKIHRRHFFELDSTNNWCKQHAHELQHGTITLVTAAGQTAGRGRFKRRWESPSGLNIYATFCFFLPVGSRDIGNIPQVLALSAANILKKMHLSPEIKWPNDILLSKKKVAGILAETTTFPDGLCMVLGIGLNVNMPLEILQAIDRPATSLLVETGHVHEVEKVLEDLQIQFAIDLDTFLQKGFGPFLEAYRKAMPAANFAVRFHDNQRIWEGVVHHIDEAGAMVLKLADGTLKTFLAGEILWPGE